MLNEIWRLRQALEKTGIKLTRKNPRVQTPGRTWPCLRICLDENGKVSSVQDIGDDDWPSWTIMEGKMNSFPVVRVQEPIYRLDRDHEIWTKLGYDEKDNRRRPSADHVRLDSLENLLKSDRNQGLSGKTKNLWRRLRNQKAKELAGCARDHDPPMKPVALFADRFMKAAEVPESLLQGGRC
jgi:hypothetical protein